MNQPNSGPSGSGRNPVVTRSLGFALQTELIPLTSRQQHAIHDALRLLAAWAVRAAQTQVEGQVLLDCIGPQSDECIPIRAQGRT